MRDRRRTPFFYLTVGASRTLRQAFPVEPRGQRTTALAIYAAMCEIANEQRGRDFNASRALIAEHAGVGVRTLDAYAERLCHAGLIEKYGRQDGGLHLPNAWSLIDVADPVEEPSATPEGVAQPNALVAQPNALLAQPVRGGGAANDTTLAQSVRGGGAAGAPPTCARVREEVEEVEEGLKNPLSPTPLFGADGLLIEPLGPVLTPWPESDRERDRVAVAQARTEEITAWLTDHPASPELMELAAPLMDRARRRFPESTFKIWISKLHAHQVTEEGYAFGVPGDLAHWLTDPSGRFLRPLHDLARATAAGREQRVVIFECPCPGYSFDAGEAAA